MKAGRIAALYDIHGNLPALEAVLEEVDREGVETVLVGGDVLPGPMPREVLSALRDRSEPLVCLRGNGENDALAMLAGEAAERVPEPFREAVRWSGEALSAGDRAWIDGWEATARLEVAGVGDVLCCHATPTSDAEIFTRRTPERELRRLFDGTDAALVLCGHTHMPFDRQIGRTRVVNVGSVGMPFGRPGADWAVIGPGVELRHTNYDLAAAAERVRATEYPNADAFAARSILNPPAETEMLRLFQAS